MRERMYDNTNKGKNRAFQGIYDGYRRNEFSC